MDSLIRSIRILRQRPQDADIPSVVIGGVAGALWAEPRVTRDVDLVSTRLRDHEDAASVVRRQGERPDDGSIRNWLRQFEQARDGSALVAEYERLRGG